MNKLFCAAIAGLVGMTWLVPARAQDAYVVGVTGALTGPAAGTFAPSVEGLRLYIDKINAAGGIKGRQINLIVLDDQGEASKGATNAKRLVREEGLVLLVNSSISTTFAPFIAEATRRKVPLLFAGAACPDGVYPPAQSLLFCSTEYSPVYDTQAALDFLKGQAGANTRVGLATMGIPLSRSAIDFAAKRIPEMGMTVGEIAIIPPATPDFTAAATRVQQGNPPWIYSWAPWVAEVKTFEALRKIGWGGSYVTWITPETENELARLKDDKLYVLGAHAFFADDLPVQREITAAANAGKTTYPANQMSDGWVGGMVIEAALKAAESPTPGAVLKAMQNLSVDTKGLRGGALEWTPNNHFRKTQYYRVYRWSNAQGKPELVKDWFSYPIK